MKLVQEHDAQTAASSSASDLGKKLIQLTITTRESLSRERICAFHSHRRNSGTVPEPSLEELGPPMDSPDFCGHFHPVGLCFGAVLTLLEGNQWCKPSERRTDSTIFHSFWNDINFNPENLWEHDEQFWLTQNGNNINVVQTILNPTQIPHCS
ncbi:hypothetical protein B0H14DRAFT_2605148 [Mycena olivaceomarginata]|nr:hypothetical protein B0H14DRAFT_2605148 [Mycena olivaceomarginata]